ncbi:MAG: phenylalanine--tRNA ligase subunit alpha [Acidimicrobiales bacterium]|jgi:phenylalanyl-tRNA synthetase alpha chain|nr:phenylalanine--tRNA ligase subunit alpha [Acidimicrobiales bacterium]MDP7125415.1 phenylalanine--tRNA ligase subunit alpha [Acidimicrobiales bacterium]MDP7352299.1 phenylalanine--tRNA ligase subunit alpha [Acidimicrobiales bacterium]MDP7507939.1 phenylalanine--tRNA ligase subunit alpha [Acidimicrobiales bacterium]MEE1564997.1 phenylalanine--tRNA ligase subunit alpha [Acidimicrobiales bacterium]|tara:strand:+ start:3265 stop:4263 length:999 start_codon:yes stop_codon:yes gene_type:complete
MDLDLDAHLIDAAAAVADASDLDALAAVDAELLGRKSLLATVRSQLGDMEPDQRKETGRRVHEVRTEIERLVADRRVEVAAGARAVVLEAERLDLTEFDRGRRLGHRHVVTQTWERLEDLFVGMGYTVAEGPEIEDEWHNFGALNFPSDHPARDMYDTLYVDYGEPLSTLLRTHTSPVQIRVMEEQEPPIYSIMPGRVFRSDTADATHMPVFHQIEGLVVDRGITFGDLAGTLDAFTTAYFGSEFTSRLRPSYFPFTEPSAEFDIRRPDGSWLELGGCGMVHPRVLSACGLDPEEWSGFAFGFGLDRLALMRHGIDDLRELFRNDHRFLGQF